MYILQIKTQETKVISFDRRNDSENKPLWQVFCIYHGRATKYEGYTKSDMIIITYMSIKNILAKNRITLYIKEERRVYKCLSSVVLNESIMMFWCLNVAFNLPSGTHLYPWGSVLSIWHLNPARQGSGCKVTWRNYSYMYESMTFVSPLISNLFWGY